MLYSVRLPRQSGDVISSECARAKSGRGVDEKKRFSIPSSSGSYSG